MRFFRLLCYKGDKGDYSVTAMVPVWSPRVIVLAGLEGDVHLDHAPAAAGDGHDLFCDHVVAI